ncbi:hypothetical protein BO78DRAFT_30111 [Aspergillus sclerotiicarbonarius CBS 121057]|uniref:Uncharacterized protein n=1 Tax=Aspergillus sclerotiicarbonarius (strain CBS 121057 / IBT 28362) TaxID=1448318 RepID=A0A319ERG2_ASPSB|nr:hypothetical protein BO78DRAFT_30111 [Aspergillus sclerotiicarbonarius CBS 121057]
MDAVVDLTWYEGWLTDQLSHLPFCLHNLRVGDNSQLSIQTVKGLFIAVGSSARENEGLSIDEIIQHLQDDDILEEGEEHLASQRLLIFAILGWQSMLYQAAFNVSSVQELAIHHDSCQPQSGMVFDAYRVSADLSDRPLSILLKAFGNLLPARSSALPRLASENTKLAATWQPLYPTETNAYLFHTLLSVRFQWVDTLALHLDYDKSSRTLSLFSYPSMCLDALQSRGIVYAFASIENAGEDPRADGKDISQFLQEVLLSYRLLFGQSAASRKLFRHAFVPAEITQGHHMDSLLPHLCTRKQLGSSSSAMPLDRPIYFAARDFPVLYERGELIAKELRDARPKSMQDLLRDRRDTLQYWTFWLVSIFGSISIF